MAYETSRRDFLKVLGGLGAAAFAGCKTVSKDSELEQLVSDATAFAEEHKKDLKLDVSEISQAATYALALESQGKKAEASAMADIVQYGLKNGSGNLYVAVNLKVDGQQKEWQGKTQVTTQDLAKDLSVAEKDATYFAAKHVLYLASRAAEEYTPLPPRNVKDHVVMQKYGFMIADGAELVKKLLQAGNFDELNGGMPFTARTHEILSGNDATQGAYFKHMPLAMKLVITKGAEYQATKK